MLTLRTRMAGPPCMWQLWEDTVTATAVTLVRTVLEVVGSC